MNVPFLVAGVMSIAGACIHGVGGEILVVRKLTDLPSTTFGGRSMTKSMIQISWHIVTIGFLTFGVGMAVCGGSAGSGACDGIGLAAASAFTAIAAMTFGVLIHQMGVRQVVRTVLFRHQAPLAFVVVATLAWAGVA